MPDESAPQLGVKVRWDGVVVKVTLTGELDFTSAPALTSSLRKVAAARPERFVLDLSGVDFVDVAAARALEGTCKLLAAGCPVIVRGLRPPARRVFELTAVRRQPGQEVSASLLATPVQWHQPIRPQSPRDLGKVLGGGPSVSPLPPEPRRGLAAERLALLSRIRAELRRAEDLHEQAQATMAWSYALVEANERIRGSKGKPVTWSRELLEWSPYARLLAQVASMPVIEQAKGIVMAQIGCGDELAFGMLRRASQRTNVPVRELAAKIVARATQRRDSAGRTERPGLSGPD